MEFGSRSTVSGRGGVRAMGINQNDKQLLRDTISIRSTAVDAMQSTIVSILATF